MAKIIQKECASRNSNIGIKLVPRGTTIPFLNFTDDTLIFAKADNIKAINKINEILTDFSSKFGLTMNYNKSSMQVSANIYNQDAKK